jgi:hypothetical protein
MVVVAWLHASRPDVDPFRRGVSRYAAGSYGYAVSAAFALLAVSLLIAASQLRGAANAVSMVLYRRSLTVGAAGLLVVVLFPLRSASPEAGEYVAHQLGGAIFFIGATIGVQAIPDALRRLAVPGWLTTLARSFARVSVVLLLVFFASVLSNVPALNSVRGILQRSCFIALCTSLIALGIALLNERPANIGLQPTAAGEIMGRRG